jgi:hypothetical protein
MLNKRVKVWVLKWLKNVKSIVLNVYCSTYYLRYYIYCRNSSALRDMSLHLLWLFVSPWMNVHCSVFVCICMVTCITAQTWVVLNLPFIHFGCHYDWNSFKSLINFCVKDSKSHVSLMVIKCCRMLVCNIWQQWSVGKFWIMTTWFNTLVNILLQFSLCSGLMWYSLIWPCHLLIFLA